MRDLKAKAPRPKHGAFKAYEPGHIIHIDVKYLPQMTDESSRRYLFVAIDRATRWVFIRVFKSKTAANARRFLHDLERACPLLIRRVLPDNGKEFTDRLFGLRKRATTGEREFDTLCAALDIDHRLTPPKSPQTNGTAWAIFSKGHGKVRVDDRRVLSGMIFIDRNGVKWSDAAAEYGPPKTLYNRRERWSDMWVFARIMTGLKLWSCT